MNCQSCRIEIEELEMGGTLSKQASAHLDTCSPCGAFYNERLSLRRLVGSLEPVTAPPDFEFRLRARLAASADGERHRFSLRSFIASAPAIGLAASFALLIAGVAAYNHFKSGSGITNQPSEVARQSPTQEAPQLTKSDKNIPAGNVASQVTPAVSTPDKTAKRSPETAQAGNNSFHPRPAPQSKMLARRQPKQPEAGSQQLVVSEPAFRPATRITLSGETPFLATSHPLVELPVRSSSQPMKVFVDDKSGGKRSVTLEPVIFGSQDFTGRNISRLPTSQGIW